jgi:ribulose-phosphate 3-epimerase
MMQIIPTVVPKTFDDIVAAKLRYSTFVSSLHVDATDGILTSEKTWLPMSGEKLPDAQTVYYEAHLMIENPLSVGVAFARAGARRIIGHVEGFKNAECAREAFDMWQRAGAEEVGVAILLDTPLQELAPYAQIVDFVHVMTIARIGKQGYVFDERSIARIQDIHVRYPNITISTDGGETEDNIDDLARVGVSRFCIGSALAKAKDPAKTYSRLMGAVQV